MHDFILFLTGNLILCLITGIFFGIRRLFRKSLSAGSRYRFWYFYMAFLLLPFLPIRISLLPANLIKSFLHHPASKIAADTFAHAASPLAETLTDGTWMQDFYVPSGAQTLKQLPALLFILWILGMCVFTAAALFVFLRTHLQLKSATKITAESLPEIASVFSDCKNEKRITCRVKLYMSPHTASPICLGLFAPKILLPETMTQDIDPGQLRYIFLHELQHCRQKDSIMNALICLLRIPYWFNPAVLLTCKKIQTDREIACDQAVIRPLTPKERIAYGCMLLSCAGSSRPNPLTFHTSTLGAGQSQLKQRIQHIAASGETAKYSPKKAGTILAAVLMCLLLLAASPFLCVQARDISKAFSTDLPQTATAIDLSNYFSGYDGTFVLCDMDTGQYTIYNETESRKRFSPVSTYKIPSALFALDAGVITPSDTRRQWDGSGQPYDSWERDQTLKTAMKASVNWYFHDLDLQTGFDRLTADFQKIHYGNADITSGLSDYWLDGSLKISTLEQTAFLNDFYKNAWDFNPEDVKAVKESLFLTERGGCRLYGKTGTQATEDALTGGWFVGFLETADHTYSFSVHLAGKKDAGGSMATAITLDIFEDLELF